MGCGVFESVEFGDGGWAYGGWCDELCEYL